MEYTGDIVTVINQEILQGGVRQYTLQLAIGGVTPLGVGSFFHHPVWPEQGPRRVTCLEWIYSEGRVNIWVEPESFNDETDLNKIREIARSHGWE